jgi:peptidoglycan hydrolase FlgJ
MTATMIMAAAGAPSAAQLADPATARVWKAAQDFEASALNELIKPMFATVDTTKDPFSGGDGEAQWQPMLVQEYAKAMSRHGGIGLAVPVFNQMLRMQEAAGSHSK